MGEIIRRASNLPVRKELGREEPRSEFEMAMASIIFTCNHEHRLPFTCQRNAPHIILLIRSTLERLQRFSCRLEAFTRYPRSRENPNVSQEIQKDRTGNIAPREDQRDCSTGQKLLVGYLGLCDDYIVFFETCMYKVFIHVLE